MKISNIYKKYLNYILWFIILMLLTLYISIKSYESTKNSYDQNKFSELKVKFQQIQNTFSRNCDLVFQVITFQNDLLTLISQINTNDSLKANQIRKKIYDKIKSLDINFKELGIFKFHIIRNDYTVFLRYFDPEKYNDSFEFQTLLTKVNTTKLPQGGFTPGVYDFSYRLIYPIIVQNNISAFIEFALSDEYVAEELSFDKSRLTLFNYYLDKLGINIPKNLVPSVFLKGFYIDKNYSSQNTISEISNLGNFFIENLTKNQNLQSYANKLTEFNLHFEEINQIHSIYFIPIYTDNNVFCGYLMHGYKNITLENQYISLVVINIASGCFLFLFLFVLAYRKNNIESLKQKIKELETEKKNSERLIKQLDKSQKELQEKADFVTKINNLLHDQDLMLRKSLDEKNRFFSILAHDIKNPITSLYTNAELLILYFDKMGEDEKREISNRILAASKNLDRLVKDLLEWGKLQLGQYTIELKEIKLKEEIDRIYESYSDSAQSKGISFENMIPNETIITSDTHIIRTIFRNLMQNSIKFTEKGKIKVQVVEQTENKIKIAFQDTGVGIPQDKIQDLFKVDKAFTTRGTRGEEGTGLGLILVNEYVKKIEGDIFVESKIGIGTTFFITLPK